MQPFLILSIKKAGLLFLCSSSMAESHSNLMVSPLLPAAVSTGLQFYWQDISGIGVLQRTGVYHIYPSWIRNTAKPSKAKGKHEQLAEWCLYYFYAGLYLTCQKSTLYFTDTSPSLQKCRFIILKIFYLNWKHLTFHNWVGGLYISHPVQSEGSEVFQFFMCRPWKCEGWL